MTAQLFFHYLGWFAFWSAVWSSIILVALCICLDCHRRDKYEREAFEARNTTTI